MTRDDLDFDQQGVDWEATSLAIVSRSLAVAAEHSNLIAVTVSGLLPAYPSLRESVQDVAMDLWHRLQLSRHRSEADVLKEVLVPPPAAVAVYAPSRQQMEYVEDCLENIKMEMQLLHAAVIDIKEQTQTQLRRLQEKVEQMPTCQCEPQEAALRRGLFAPRVVGRVSSDLDADAKEKPVIRLRRMELPLL